MFKIEVATLFPKMFEEILNSSIVGRARKFDKVKINVNNIRDFSLNSYHKVDDSPYGGGQGMVLQAEPIFRCYEFVCEKLKCRPLVIYLSPQGKTLNQNIVKKLARIEKPLFLICGHYEGIDQRVIDLIVDLEISIGDYVLTGGELPAMVLIDSIVRLLPGVLSSEECFEKESHYDGFLEHAQYTKPEVWRDLKVPSVLLSGDHEKIKKWRTAKSIENTLIKRPDLLNEERP